MPTKPNFYNKLINILKEEEIPLNPIYMEQKTLKENFYIQFSSRVFCI